MKRSKPILISISILLLMISFQNCSQVAMNDVAYSMSEGVDKSGGRGRVDLADLDGDTLVGDNNEDGEQDDVINIEQAIINCERIQASQNIQELEDGQDLSGERGNLTISAANLGILDNIQGNLNLLGASEASSIEAIKDSNGNIVVCGMDIASVSNYSRGNLIVIGGNIGDISDFTGQLTLIGGQITGAQSNVLGSVHIIE